MFLPQARRGNGARCQLDDNLWLPPELLHLGHPPYQAATSELSLDFAGSVAR
jgi:hypothetical protein